MGMAGGVAVITAAGSALGGTYGAVISNSYFGDIDGFEIVKLRPGKEPSVICIDGFLTKDDKNFRNSWLNSLKEDYPDNTIYYVKWEQKRIRDIAEMCTIVGTKTVAFKKSISVALSATKVAAKKINPLALAITGLDFAKNPWSVASFKAYQTGVLLADIIARTDKEYILIGHSLGARVIYSCLASLKTKAENKIFIKDVHLLGGAVKNDCDKNKNTSSDVNWNGLDKAVSGKINNYYTGNDGVLKFLYKVGEGIKFDFGNPIGRNKINNEKINNIDVSKYIEGHTEYKINFPKFNKKYKNK